MLVSLYHLRSLLFFLCPLSLDRKKRSSTEKNIDRSLIWLTRILAFAIAGVLLWIAIRVGLQAVPAIEEFGWSFFTNIAWNPPEQQYAILPMIFGCVLQLKILLNFIWLISVIFGIGI